MLFAKARVFLKNPGERERRLTEPPADRGLVGRPC